MKRKRITIIAAFLGLLVALALTFNSARDTSTDEVEASAAQDARVSCQLANVLVVELNRRIISHSLDTKVLQDFLAVSVDTSQRNFKRSGDPSDLRAAKAFRQFSRDLDGVTFRPVEATEDCSR